MTVPARCCICRHANATQDMELVCYQYGGDTPHRCEQFEEMQRQFLPSAYCIDCIRGKICTSQDKPVRCKFFDLKGDTPNIIRALMKPKGRWRKIDYAN